MAVHIRRTPAEVRRLVAAHMPGHRIDDVVRIGAGLDNQVYEVNGEMIVRFSNEPDPVLLDNEARLLAVVAEVSPLPVPTPTFTVPELGCMAYRTLPGSRCRTSRSRTERRTRPRSPPRSATCSPRSTPCRSSG